MIRSNRFKFFAFCSAMALALAFALPVAAQNTPAPSRQPAAAPAPTDKDVAETQDQFLHLLRLSPTLTSVVAHDPSLLSDQQYVARNNPELAQFLLSHPDVARNPEFYLFNNLDSGNGHREEALERAVWPDFATQRGSFDWPRVIEQIQPIIIMPALFLGIAWMVRLLVDSGRWNRTFKQQNEIHARLIDKLGTNQELIAYMDSEAGKRFLSGSLVAPSHGAFQRMPNAVARILTPLQAGIVMTLLGIGFLLLRGSSVDLQTPMVVLGTLVLMPGIGFILSAAATWGLAHRLGILPEKQNSDAPSAPFGSPDRQ